SQPSSAKATAGKEEIDEMDKILGLNIRVLAEQIQEIPDEILDLQKQRNHLRKNPSTDGWRESDQIRDRIESKGFRVKDFENKTEIYRTLSSMII
ncbi:MAG: hypothetical protein AAB738_01840, partial [Patescibacteria group bacterium]